MTEPPADRALARNVRPFALRKIGDGLAFASSLQNLAAALHDGGEAGTAVVQAPPGTGKTTLVPPLIANIVAERAQARQRNSVPAGEHEGVSASAIGKPTGENTLPRVVVTQPRRITARAAARRLASLDHSRLGDRVGYSVRGEHHTGPGTLVEFVTPGILLRRLLADPGLEGTAAVILDEVHERGLETDLLLGMLGEVRQLRGDLTLIAMSATLDAPRFAALIGGYDGAGPAPVIDCPSALHPLEVSWAPPTAARLDGRGVSRAFLDHMADTAATAHAAALAENSGVDALVFVPGAWEVAQVASRLNGRVGAGTEVLQLHGRADPATQDRAVSGRKPGDLPRIIVSTSLAESSLTVPGVRLVIDSGLAREPRRDASRGMSGLVTVSASRASADQRAGRAARQGPGRVVRCYDQKTFGAAPAHPTPEIAVADLAGAALTLACWGAPGGAGLALPDAPPPAAMTTAVEVLRELGAVDADGRATTLGRTLVRVPADPRLARALLDGAAVVGRRTAAQVVAMVSGDLRAPGADLTRLLASLCGTERSSKDPATRRWAEEARRMEEIAGRETPAQRTTATDEAARPAMAKDATASRPTTSGPKMGGPRASGPRVSGPTTSGPKVSGLQVSSADAVGYVVALAFPDRVAQRMAGVAGTNYLLASGTRAGLPAGSPLAGQQWLAVAEVSRAQGRDAAGTGAVIRAAAPLEADTAKAAARHLVTDSVQAHFEGGRVVARRELRLGAIVLSTTPVRPSAAEGRNAVARALAIGGLGGIGWSPKADALRRRMALLHHVLGEPWPDVAEAALVARLAEWLAPELEKLASGTPADRIDLAEPLRRLLPWPAAGRLGELAPERLGVPSGSQVRIHYPEVDDDGGRPVVAVKLQECFGWAQTPRLVDSRVPVLFHLLSPAGQPLAVTDDLASFWSGPYAQVRAEMRGRYPKHPWPEDPWTAPATGRVKKRM